MTRATPLVFAVLAALACIASPAVAFFENVQRATLTYAPEPAIPHLAKLAPISGEVRLRVTVGTDGSVKEIRFISGHPFLLESAMDAVKQWRYRPTTFRQQLVEAIITEVVRFRLGEIAPIPSPACP